MGEKTSPKEEKNLSVKIWIDRRWSRCRFEPVVIVVVATATRWKQRRRGANGVLCMGTLALTLISYGRRRRQRKLMVVVRVGDGSNWAAGVKMGAGGLRSYKRRFGCFFLVYLDNSYVERSSK